MAKQKTNRSAKKRFSVSAGGKIEHRPARQAHFNARATGNETRKKHNNKQISQSDKGRVHELLPNS